MDKISRRSMLRMGAIAAGGILAGCAPQVVKETVVVEKEVEKVVKETVVVEQEVEKQVTVEVDRAAERAATLQANIVWDTFRGVGTGWNEERISTFKDIYPNVNIEFRPMVLASQQEAYGKMFAMAAAGDLGDLIAFDPSHFHFWRAVNKNVIMPMDDLVEADGLDLTQWFEQFIEMQRYKGKFYGLPSWGWSGQDSLGINTKHFDEMGIPAPAVDDYSVSMDTIGEWARTFYQAGEGPGQVGRYGIQPVYSDQGLSVLTCAFGGQLINAEGTQCELATNEKSRAALKWLYDLCVVDKVASIPGDFQNATAAWADGKVTMYQGGSLSLINLKKAITDAELAELSVVFFPKRADGMIPSQLRGGCWNINAASKYPEATYEFMKHIAGKEGTVGFNLVGGNGALTRPDVLPILAARDEVYQWFQTNLTNGMPIHPPANSRGREYTDACTQWLGKMMDRNNPIPFEQGLQELHDNVQKVLDLPEP